MKPPKPRPHPADEQMMLFSPADCVPVGSGQLIARSKDAELCHAAHADGYELGVRNVERCGTRWNTALAKHNGGDHYSNPTTRHIRDEFCRGYYEGCCKRLGIDPANPAPRPRQDPPPPKATARSIRYRNPDTGETWTGRGMQPAWIKFALQCGRALTEFAAQGGAST